MKKDCYIWSIEPQLLPISSIWRKDSMSFANKDKTNHTIHIKLILLVIFNKSFIFYFYFWYAHKMSRRGEAASWGRSGSIWPPPCLNCANKTFLLFRKRKKKEYFLSLLLVDPTCGFHFGIQYSSCTSNRYDLSKATHTRFNSNFAH